MTNQNITIAVAKGDGIGPEIMDAVLNIFDKARVPLKYEFVEMGKSLFEKGQSTGMTDDAKETIEKLGILFKGPMETPKGKGIKSINVTARKIWNTFANVRKFRSFQGVDTVFSRAGIPINMTVLRENIEDTYGGIEYMHTYDVAMGYKIITKPGSEQFMRFAFEYARREGITEITCGHKANIMKMTDGLFMNSFYEIAKEYPDIKANDLIVDDLAMKLVRFPDRFRLIVMTNLQGDILSDLCAGLVGGLGFAPSANIGHKISIFEAVHGTAPDIAGKHIANPSSLLMSGIMMLRHIGFISYADMIENAFLKTLEDGTHTGDFGNKEVPSVNTDQFAEAIIKNLGDKPEKSEPVKTGTPDFRFSPPPTPQKLHIMSSENIPAGTIDGVDIFVESSELPENVSQIIKQHLIPGLELEMISNRGTMVYPESSVFTECVAHYCVRLTASQNIEPAKVFEMCSHLCNDLKIVNIELLKSWGDIKGYSLAQGQ